MNSQAIDRLLRAGQTHQVQLNGLLTAVEALVEEGQENQRRHMRAIKVIALLKQEVGELTARVAELESRLSLEEER